MRSDPKEGRQLMNSTLQFLFSRRSVRAYEERPVPDELVTDLLEAAMAAPSACCKDPWEFVVIRDGATLAALAEKLPNAPMLPKAAAGIVVCGDLEKAHDGLLSYLLQDCSAAIQNILLAANALGLGACWLGIHPRDERIAHVSRVLGLPTHVLPVSAIAIGWPATAPPARTRYQPGVVHDECW